MYILHICIILILMYIAEPVIIKEPTLDLSINVINEDQHAAEFFRALLPVVSDENGPFSHLYIVCINGSVLTSTKRMVINVKDLTTQELLEKSSRDNPDFYIAAVVDATQYKENYRMGYRLGAEDSTTDKYGHEFNNRKLISGLKHFFRVFSINSTEEV